MMGKMPAALQILTAPHAHAPALAHSCHTIQDKHKHCPPVICVHSPNRYDQCARCLQMPDIGGRQITEPMAGFIICVQRLSHIHAHDANYGSMLFRRPQMIALPQPLFLRLPWTQPQPQPQPLSLFLPWPVDRLLIFMHRF